MARLASSRGSVRCAALSLCLALVCLLAPWSTPSIAAQTLDLAGYRQIIASSLSDLRQGTASPHDVADRLRSITAVTMPDRSSITPDVQGVIGYLDGTPPRVSDAESSLAAILAELDRAQANPMTAGERRDATARLNSILARSEFHARPEHHRQSIAAWIGHQLGRLLGPIFAPIGRIIAGWLWAVVPSTSVWTVAVIAVGLVAIVAVVVVAVRGIRRAFGPPVARLPESLGRRSISAAELRAEAEALARNRSYRLAVRALYLSALIQLDEQGILPFERSLTNREVLHAAAARGGSMLGDRLAPLVERFDLYWYGSESCGEADYKDFVRLTTWALEAK